jgi:hypothetical protein
MALSSTGFVANAAGGMLNIKPIKPTTIEEATRVM